MTTAPTDQRRPRGRLRPPPPRADDAGVDPQPRQLVDHRGRAGADRHGLGAPASQTAWLISALYLATAIGQPLVGPPRRHVRPPPPLPRRCEPHGDRRAARRPRPEHRRAHRRPRDPRLRHLRRLSRLDVPDPQRGQAHRDHEPRGHPHRPGRLDADDRRHRADPRRPAHRHRRVARDTRHQRAARPRDAGARRADPAAPHRARDRGRTRQAAEPACASTSPASCCSPPRWSRCCCS